MSIGARSLRAAIGGGGAETETVVRRIACSISLALVVFGLLGVVRVPAALASTVSKSGSVVVYTAVAGEANNLTVAVVGIKFSQAFRFVDSTLVPVTAGPGCVSVNANTAQCPTLGVSSISIDVRDLNDTVAVNANVNTPTTIAGGAGDDVLTGGSAADTIEGDDGNDTIHGAAGDDTLEPQSPFGGTCADVDTLSGDAGDDLLHGGLCGTASLHGGDGNDTLDGTRNSSHSLLLDGGPGNDTLEGGRKADTYAGGTGIDTASYADRTTGVVVTLDGAANDGAPGESDNVRTDVENVIGGSGPDTLSGSLGANALNGGPGVDTVTYAGRSESLSISLDGIANDGAPGEGDNVGTDVENIVGGSGDDVLSGTTGANAFTGGAGVDTVTYADRTNPVTVSLDGVANDGESGEGDNVGTDVENLVGGAGADTLTGSADANVFDGGPGADTFAGGGGVDTVTYAARTNPVVVSLDGVANDGESGEGDNVGVDVENVLGGSGNDSLTGSADANILTGGAGDDTLDGGLGADTLNGGLGVDTVTYATRTNPVTVTLDGLPNDGEAGENDLVGADIENATGGSGSDTLTGDAGPNVLTGGGGGDTLDGGPGADALNGGPGNDLVTYATRVNPLAVSLDGVANDGEPGENDNVATDVENVTGGAGGDTLVGSPAANTLQGGAGDDTLDGGLGPDALLGGTGIDTADYSSRAGPVTVTLDGASNDGAPGEGDLVGADVENAVGGAGADTLVGSSGPNVLRGGPGIDSLSGGGGNDVLDGGTGADTLAGGAGKDTADYSSRSNPVTVTLDGAANDGEPGEGDKVATDVENVNGGSGADTIVGSAGANVLRGGPGNDSLNGSGGNDVLGGGPGDDAEVGGDGNDTFDQDAAANGADTLSGGAGKDTASYALRSVPVSVSLDGVANDGEAGEGDDVGTDVENVTGGSGDDTLAGSAAANVLTGGAGDDAESGGGGSDTFKEGTAPNGSDTLNGGLGKDTVDYSLRTGNLSVTLDGAANDGEAGENDNVQADVENVKAGSGDDAITGSAAANSLVGGLGGDSLFGLGGADTLNVQDGISGNDSADGGTGTDTCLADPGDTVTNCP